MPTWGSAVRSRREVGQQAGRDRVRKHEQSEADCRGDRVRSGLLGCGEQRQADRARAVIDDRGDGHQAERQSPPQGSPAGYVGAARRVVPGGGERREREDCREEEREQHGVGRRRRGDGSACKREREHGEHELLHGLRLHVLACAEVADEAHGERSEHGEHGRGDPREGRLQRRAGGDGREQHEARLPVAGPRRAPRAAHRGSRCRGLRHG